MKEFAKNIPRDFSETAFGKYVSDLSFGVDVLDINASIDKNSLQEPVDINAVDSWDVPHRDRTCLQAHLDAGIIVFQNYEFSSTIDRGHVAGDKIDVQQFLNIAGKASITIYDLTFNAGGRFPGRVGVENVQYDFP